MKRIKFIDSDGVTLYEFDRSNHRDTILPVTGDYVWLPNQGDAWLVTRRDLAFDLESMKSPNDSEIVLHCDR